MWVLSNLGDAQTKMADKCHRERERERYIYIIHTHPNYWYQQFNTINPNHRYLGCIGMDHLPTICIYIYITHFILTKFICHPGSTEGRCRGSCGGTAVISVIKNYRRVGHWLRRLVFKDWRHPHIWPVNPRFFFGSPLLCTAIYIYIK